MGKDEEEEVAAALLSKVKKGEKEKSYRNFAGLH